MRTGYPNGLVFLCQFRCGRAVRLPPSHLPPGNEPGYGWTFSTMPTMPIRPSSATATRSTASSICTCSTCSSASATTKRRRSCASTCCAPVGGVAARGRPEALAAPFSLSKRDTMSLIPTPAFRAASPRTASCARRGRVGGPRTASLSRRLNPQGRYPI